MSRQTTVQRQVETQEGEFVLSDAGVSFSGGVLHFNGAPHIPHEVNKWESSNGLTEYTTVTWRDPGTGQLRVSCNCPGWSHRRPGRTRECKHTREQMGQLGACDARRANVAPIRPQTIAEATQLIPKFEGRPLRDLMLD